MKATRMFCLVMMALLAADGANAARPPASRRPRPMGSTGIDNSQTIDINNIKMFITNTGSFAWDKTTGQAGLEFPKGTGKTAVFAAGLWIGGLCSDSAGVPLPDVLNLAVSEYSDEYGPGAMVGGTFDSPDKPEYKVYKLNRTYPTDAERQAALDDYNAGAVPHGAPVVTVQTDGSLDILGDQMCWAVYNDADVANHANAAGLTYPMGLEVQQTTFAFQRQGALGNTIFIKYKIINKGVKKLHDMYVSQWSDPDLGGATDDIEGCDVSKSLGFIYNSTNSDGQYGTFVPCVGYEFFQGPSVGGTPLPMASFNVYPNGGGPQSSDQTYNFMKGLDANGNVLTDPTTGQPTAFMFPGDPVAGSGWLDTTPSDHRLMLSTGPFDMNPGDQQEVVTGIVIGQSRDRICSISLMKFFDDEAQSAFDQNFVIPHPPATPQVTATPQNGAVLLTWDTGAENYSSPPYAFEGYVVYQGSSVAGPFTRVATYDIDNNITRLLDASFDDESCLALDQISALGTNAGTRYQFRLTTDQVKGGPLLNATPYFYTVTAYAVATGQAPQVLESAFNVLTVVPQGPPGGVDWGSASVTPPVQGGRVVGPAPGTDVVSANIVDPNQVINANYLVGYKPDATGTMLWYLVRTVGAQVDTVLNNQTNFKGDDSYPVFDGLQVKVTGAPLGLLLSASFVPATAGTPAPFAGDVNVGGRFFDGSADYSANILPTGSAIDPTNPATSFDVEIRFTGPLGVNQVAGQKAYLYFRTQDAGGARVYAYQNYIDVPFTVWDTNANRQLNVGFLENQGNPVTAPGTNVDNTDNRWDPDNIPDFAGGAGDGREFLNIYSSTYSATPDPTYQGDWLVIGANLDGLYGFWPNTVDSVNAPVRGGDKVVFTTAKRGPNDIYTFASTAANRFNETMAKNELDLVKAVPNPYFAHSSYELNQFIRVLKFTHLPALCTIRLFNLSGELVRTIEKNDNTSQATWDLLTTNGLPIGSGVYVFHIEAPGVGTKIGKVIVFMEKERLNNF